MYQPCKKNARHLPKKRECLAVYRDEDIKINKGRSYQDVTALRDPLMGYGLEKMLEEENKGDNSASFEGTEQDEAVQDYSRNQPRDKNGR